MASGAGLPLLAVTVTVLHFVVVLGYTPLIRRLPGYSSATRLQIHYQDGHGVLRHLLTACSARGWVVSDLAIHPGGEGDLSVPVDEDFSRNPTVTVALGIAGRGSHDAINALGQVDGVIGVSHVQDDTE